MTTGQEPKIVHTPNAVDERFYFTEARVTTESSSTSTFTALTWIVPRNTQSPNANMLKSSRPHEKTGQKIVITYKAVLGGLPVLTLPFPLDNGLSAGLQIIVNNPQSPVLPWALQSF